MPVDLTDYPPARHVLRDLALEFAHGDGVESHAWLPVTEHVCTPSGHVHAGILATAVDAIGGGLAAIAAAPGWIATADLTLHVVTPLVGPALHIVGRVVRAGRTTAVLEADVRDDRRGAGLGALATMTFSVLPRRDANPVVEPAPTGEAPTRRSMAVDGSGFDEPAYGRFGFVDDGAGTVEVDVATYIGNSLGAVQGGVLASLADAAAASALGVGFETVDLQMFYVALAKEGPVRASATVVDRDERRGSVAVTIDDVGAARRTTNVNAVAVRW